MTTTRFTPTHSTAQPSAAPATSPELERLLRSQRSDAGSTHPTPAQTWVATLHRSASHADALDVLLEDGRHLLATRAASCLLLPQPGDLVQLLLSEQRCWVLQVLERAQPTAPQTLDLGVGDVHLLAHGKLHLQADSLQETAVRKHSDIQGWSTARAAFMDMHAERQLNLFGGVTTVLADALLKADAAQIHMG